MYVYVLWTIISLFNNSRTFFSEALLFLCVLYKILILTKYFLLFRFCVLTDNQLFWDFFF